MRCRARTVIAFGTGFLLGSRAGTGPWEAFCSKMAAAKEKFEEAQGGRAAGDGRTVSNSGDSRMPISSV